jgi:hypothetical protein
MTRNVQIAAGIVTVAVVVLAGYLLVQIHFAGAPHDSPVTVAGGSIKGVVRGTNAWQKRLFESIYSAPASGNDYIVLSGLVDDKEVAAPSPLTNTGGWLIMLSTKYPAGQTKSGSISFCSDVSTNTIPHCTGAGLRKDGVVFLQANNNSRFETRSSGELHFHDQDKTCDGNENSEGPCDKISFVTIQTVSSPTVTTYHCRDETQCTITVGK